MEHSEELARGPTSARSNLSKKAAQVTFPWDLPICAQSWPGAGRRGQALT